MAVAITLRLLRFIFRRETQSLLPFCVIKHSLLFTELFPLFLILYKPIPLFFSPLILPLSPEVRIIPGAFFGKLVRHKPSFHISRFISLDLFCDSNRIILYCNLQ